MGGLFILDFTNMSSKPTISGAGRGSGRFGFWEAILNPAASVPSERLELSSAGRFERFDERLVTERASGADARLDRRLFLGRDLPGLDPVTQHRPPVAMQSAEDSLV